MPVKRTTDPEKPVRLAVAKLLTQASAEIKKVKDPSTSLKNIDKTLEKLIGKLKDGGGEDDC